MIDRAVGPRPPAPHDLRVWGLVIAYFVVSAAVFTAAGFRISLVTGIAMAGLVGVGSAISIVAIIVMPHSRTARIIGAVHQQLVFGLASAMLSYGAAMTHRPLADATLLAVDRALGYDWQRYVSFVIGHPLLSEATSYAYDTLFWQMLVITIVAGLLSDRRPLQQFVTTHVMVLLLTIGLFALWPVTTAWVYLSIDAQTLRSLHLVLGGWPQQLLELRAGHVHDVTPLSNFAIVGFPSYHCAAGLINAWAAWRYRWLRWPMVVITGTMIAATPINGGHYVTDLIGAAGVTVIAVWLAKTFLAIPLPALRRLRTNTGRGRPAAA